jgi:hypothetical protein
MLSAALTGLQLIKGTRAVFMNGFVFDELPLDMVVSAINLAHSMGAAIFFDPGGWPSGWAC